MCLNHTKRDLAVPREGKRYIADKFHISTISGLEIQADNIHKSYEYQFAFASAHWINVSA